MCPVMPLPSAESFRYDARGAQKILGLKLPCIVDLVPGGVTQKRQDLANYLQEWLQEEFYGSASLHMVIHCVCASSIAIGCVLGTAFTAYWHTLCYIPTLETLSYTATSLIACDYIVSLLQLYFVCLSAALAVYCLSPPSEGERRYRSAAHAE
jgi:hypothetical protein